MYVISAVEYTLEMALLWQ